jgi:hypothetical protein
VHKGYFDYQCMPVCLVSFAIFILTVHSALATPVAQGSGIEICQPSWVCEPKFVLSVGKLFEQMRLEACCRPSNHGIGSVLLG